MTSSSPKRVVILGATSGIAEATARLYAAEGASLLLAARSPQRLDALAADLRVRGATATTRALDLATEPDVPAAFAAMVATLGGVDHVLLAYGTMSDAKTAERAPADMLAVNFTSAAAWTLAAAAVLEAQGFGSLVVLGSVAGDRGRRSNTVYGAAKSGLATLVQGIAHRFGSRGPRAVVVKPGPTDTPMTAGMKKGGPMWASAEQVARVVRRAADRGGPVVYAPARWRWIMLAIRCLPSAMFNRLDI